MRTIGIALLLTSVASVALGAASVPEIDGASAPAAIGLLAGAYLVLRARKSRKKS